MPELMNIAIVGNGNVARYFSDAFTKAGLNVIRFARNPQGDDYKLDDLRDSASSFELILLCVSDGAIREVSADIPKTSAIVAHVSGAMPMEQIDSKHKNRAVFYPLMSLKNSKRIDPATIPICLEANDERDVQHLTGLAKKLNARYYPVDSEKRVYLHLAAVLAQNFTNHLYHLAKNVLHEADLDFRILLPLIENAVQNLNDKDPKNLQTGPALRGDEKTISRHLELIKDPLTADIYKLLTKSIQQAHE